jgi:hypothetical protein
LSYALTLFRVRRFRSDRGRAALALWTLAGAAVAAFAAWSVTMAERESRGHAITQAAW